MRTGWFLAGALVSALVTATIALGFRYTIVAGAPDQDGQVIAWRVDRWTGAAWLCVKSQLDTAPSCEATVERLSRRRASARETLPSSGHAHLGQWRRLPDLLVPPT
jgi:hypothetical protein